MNTAASKYRGGTGRGQSVSLDREPRVLDYDDHGTDDGANGVARRIVTLVKGFAFHDAAEHPGDDPDGAMAGHSSGFDSVKEALIEITKAKPCHCGRCTR